MTLPTPDQALERKRARHAQEAFDTYLGSYLQEQTDTLIAAFQAAIPTDTDTLTRIKYQLDAITALNVAIQQDIVTGTILQHDGDTNG